MKIKELLPDSRPREKFLKHGPERLSDAELFAILLRTGTRGKLDKDKKLMRGENVVEMSNRLISEYGLDKLFECSLKELQQIKGIGPAKAMQILSISEISKRRIQSEKPTKKISCAKDVFNLFHEKLKDKKEEHFYILMLSTQNNIIGEQLISKGILDSSIIHPREIFRPAIRNACSKIILIHNHPSGNPEPSVEDLEITKQLTKTGEEIGIKVLDHVIIGDGKFWSWTEKTLK